MRPQPRVLIAAVLSLLVAGAAHAQLIPPRDTAGSRLTVGSRVKLRTTSSDADIYGRVAEIAGDTIVIARPEGLLRFPMEEISQLYVHGRGTAGQQAAAALGVVGLAGGVALYFEFCSHNRATCEEDYRKAQEDTSYHSPLPPLFIVSVVGTGLLGVALGEAFTPPHWESAKGPFRIGLLPTRRGLMVVGSVTIRGRRRRAPLPLQSDLRATSGSMRVARRAGSTLATSAIAISSAVTPTNVIASVDVTP